MEVDILRYPTDDDWTVVKCLCRNTMRKEGAGAKPSLEWKRRLLDAGHSPIRSLVFTISMKIPYYVSVHFSRHKIGVEHYVSSQRNDRQKEYDREKAPQDAEVTHIMVINADALMGMAHRRLCGQADPVTRSVMREICRKVTEICPEFEGLLVPMCVYRGFVCHELKSCGSGLRMALERKMEM